MRIALLGSGRMAHVYGPKIAAHPAMELAFVFKPNPSSASAGQAAAAYGGAAVHDLDEALAGADAVVIATPTNTHLEYIEACAKAGKPIYCEKPLDESLERVDRCLAALEAHPVVVSDEFELVSAGTVTLPLIRRRVRATRRERRHDWP